MFDHRPDWLKLLENKISEDNKKESEVKILTQTSNADSEEEPHETINAIEVKMKVTINDAREYNVKSFIDPMVFEVRRGNDEEKMEAIIRTMCDQITKNIREEMRMAREKDVTAYKSYGPKKLGELMGG